MGFIWARNSSGFGLQGAALRRLDASAEQHCTHSRTVVGKQLRWRVDAAGWMEVGRIDACRTGMLALVFTSQGSVTNGAGSSHSTAMS